MKIHISFRDHEAATAVRAVKSLKETVGGLRERPPKPKDGCTHVYLEKHDKPLDSSPKVWYNNNSD